MKLLLDECIDCRLATELTEHTVQTVLQCGWAGMKNGSLLELAQKDFDAFITVDRNLSFQQQLTDYDIAVIILHASSNRLNDLQPLVPNILEMLPTAKPESVTIIRQ
ncbi:MAG: DUF5615 family PIN-like protein [Planctomycetes bacterium]|nr:DUF5615 family PIN-like protein [Planctomycetota bacterium]